MFVSTETRPIVAGMLDLTEQLESADIVLPLRIGIAAGPVILFEGDDFIGMAINLASRLCDAAGPGRDPRDRRGRGGGGRRVRRGAARLPRRSPGIVHAASRSGASRSPSARATATCR